MSYDFKYAKAPSGEDPGYPNLPEISWVDLKITDDYGKVWTHVTEVNVTEGWLKRFVTPLSGDGVSSYMIEKKSGNFTISDRRLE